MKPRTARWWRPETGERVVCELCPRSCTLAEGQAGYCGVRRNEGGSLQTFVSGGTSGLCVDPIEKKPLYHVLPGTQVLSFGTVGCNLGCTFCQNWGLSRSLDESRLRPARPEDVARAALAQRCSGVAFTYNEPIVSAEYCLEVSQACREAGLRTLAITAGYISGRAREAFFQGMDAANIDLKGFTDSFYRTYCGARLEPVLETLEYVVQETRVWTELTTLLIPGANDAEGELVALAAWVVDRLGRGIPLHFSAFHPDHRLRDRSPTPPAALHRAKVLAQEQGLDFVYLGNLRSPEGGTTFCPGCGEALITRDGFSLTSYRLKGSACGQCGHVLPGVFDANPSG